jgi:3-phenylpropionate/trans-cinnamate dioxygenase ferredoxin reductase subunit
MDSINKPLDHMLARKLLAAGVTVPPTAAADPEFELKTLLPAG